MGAWSPLGGAIVGFCNLDDARALSIESRPVLTECFPFECRVLVWLKDVRVNICVIVLGCPSPMTSYCSLCLGVSFAFSCFPLLKVDLKIAFMRPSSDADASAGVVSDIAFDASKSPDNTVIRVASSLGYSLLTGVSLASIGNSTTDLIVETSMLNFCIALLPNRTLYLEVDMRIWNVNMIFFISGCVPTVISRGVGGLLFAALSK
ncbi:hypothetical protein Tco_0387051 [Tanacetum coccineum]